MRSEVTTFLAPRLRRGSMGSHDPQRTIYMSNVAMSMVAMLVLLADVLEVHGAHGRHDRVEPTVTYVIPIQYRDAAELAAVLQPHFGTCAVMSADPRTNTLLRKARINATSVRSKVRGSIVSPSLQKESLGRVCHWVSLHLGTENPVGTYPFFSTLSDFLRLGCRLDESSRYQLIDHVCLSVVPQDDASSLR
jgi:hypothetical protein